MIATLGHDATHATLLRQQARQAAGQTITNTYRQTHRGVRPSKV